MIVISILFLCLIFILYYYHTKTYNYWKKKKVKGPEPTVLFGNFKDATLRRKTFSITMKRIYDDYPGEPFVGVYRLTTPWLMIKDLELIKHIMIKDFDVFEIRSEEITRKGLGTNLVSADGETWRILRHKFTPLFTAGKIKNMLHLIIEQGKSILDYIDIITSKQVEQEVQILAQMYTVSTIATCAFGIDIDVFNQNTLFLKTLRKMDDLIFTRTFVHDMFVVYSNFFKKINFSPFRTHVTNFFYELVTTVIKERNSKPTKRNDFMDLLLELKNKGNISISHKSQEKKLSLEITEDVIVAQAFIFYAAGYETSAITMTFMLYELAINPHIQERLIEEVDDVLSKCNGNITYDTLSQLPYMNKVFDETLRKYPLNDYLRRVAKCDYKIPGTDLIIEKGQTVIMPLMAIHHDEQLYPKPEEFDPERFDPKVSTGRHPCAYMPFGIGPRNCIGMRFSKVQSNIFMLNVLSRYRVEPTENNEIIFDPTRIMVTPQKGLKLKFISRKDKKKEQSQNI